MSVFNRNKGGKLSGGEGKEFSGQFGTEKFGQPLFYPDADKTDAELGLP